ncbi:hypothetical protein Trydic_g9756 [Trypoxylus dichotomus]
MDLLSRKSTLRREKSKRERVAIAPQSLDLFLIEFIWDEMDRTVTVMNSKCAKNINYKVPVSANLQILEEKKERWLSEQGVFAFGVKSKNDIITVIECHGSWDHCKITKWELAKSSKCTEM